MARNQWLSTSTVVTVVCMFLGLTAWYLAGKYADSSVLEFVALFGLGVILPTAINEWRRRRARDGAGR